MMVVACAEEEPVDGSFPFPDGGGWNNGICVTCGVDAGLVTTLGDAASINQQQCTQLDPGVCATYAACKPIVGMAYDPARYCRAEAQQPIYCQAAAVECGFGPVRVVDPAGQRWVLPNRCMPPGYNTAPAEIHPITWIADYTVCPSAGLQSRCGQLDEVACGTNADCFAQMGTRLNELRSCKQGAQQFVACVQNTTCNRVLTYARDPGGSVWELSGSCLPSGFKAMPSTSVASLMSWPGCGF